MTPTQLKPTLISTTKVDNGDGSFTITKLYQFTTTQVINTTDIQAQIDILTQQINELPQGAVKAQ